MKTYFLVMESQALSKLAASRQKDDILRSSDAFYPIQTVAKLSRRAVPTYATVSPEAAAEIQRCVKDFATLVSSEAGVVSAIENPSEPAVKGEDILAALSSLGYDDYADILEIYLQKLREGTKSAEELKPKKAHTAPTMKEKDGKAKATESIKTNDMASSSKKVKFNS